VCVDTSVLAEVAGTGLIWVQPKVSKPDYDLGTAGTVVARLRGQCGVLGGFDSHPSPPRYLSWERSIGTDAPLGNSLTTRVASWFPIQAALRSRSNQYVPINENTPGLVGGPTTIVAWNPANFPVPLV